MKIKVFILTVLLLFTSISSCFAATYYVDGAMPNDSGNGTSWATAKRYISSGISLMSGGDTLIIADGTYTGDSNRIASVPSGSAGNYTSIQAQNDWGVTISSTTTYSCHLNGESYVEVRGIKFKDYASLKVYVESSNHIKIIRCSSDDNGGGAAGFLAANSSYVLFEECYKYGCSRYAFQVSAGGGSSQYIIFRRCVVRWDYSNTIEPQACFANYDQDYVYFQNCIAIDGKDIRAQDVTYDGLKGFFTPNGAEQTYFQGCIALNIEGAGFWFEDSPVTNITLTDSVAWDCKDHTNSGTDGYVPRTLYIRPGDGPVTANHCTFGGSDWTSRVIDSDLGAGDTIKNSIIANFTAITDYAESGFDTSDYNDYYGNAGGRNRDGGIGAHSLTTNPFTSSLKYLPRIETSSSLDGQADDGGDIGATILKQIGVSGTLYGEIGWNTVTDDDLWPFPNEEVMRTDMKAWSKTAGEAYSGSPAMSGNRGFCADGTTLTKYIWEYLGNTIPAEIYGGSSDTTAPAAVSNLTASTGASRGSVNLSWTAPGDDGSTGTASAYIIKYATSAITNDTLFNAATDVAGEPAPAVAGTVHNITIAGLTAGTTYYFAMKTQDEVPNTSALSNSTSTVAKANTPPVLGAIGNKTVVKDSTLTFTVSATDADGDTLSYTATGLPAGAALNSSTGAFSWTPTDAQVGIHSLTFTASDGLGGTASETITITVNDANSAPVLAGIGNKSVNENALLQFTVSATDADGDTLVYSASVLPTGATFASRVFSWMPTYDQGGSYSLTFGVSDGNGGVASELISIIVANVNQAPVLAEIGSKTIEENTSLTFTVAATDADGGTITLAATNLPTGATFNSTTGVFNWIPTLTQSGNYAVTFIATDSNNASDSETVAIAVINRDLEVPYIDGLNPAADEVQVPTGSNIRFHLKDAGMGVDRDTIFMSVKREGDITRNIIVDGQSQLTSYPNSVIISGTPADYIITYDPPNVRAYKFNYQQQVTVTVNVSDLSGNSMGDYAYSFTTAMILRGANIKATKIK